MRRPIARSAVIALLAWPLSSSAGQDCNNNGIPDTIDISDGTSPDCDANEIPDECDIANCLPGELPCADCNANGIPDGCDLQLFRPQVQYDTGNGNIAIAGYAHLADGSTEPLDLDDDGDADIVTANRNAPSPSEVSVLYNDGDGVFPPQTDYTADGNFSAGVVCGDFNGDEHFDLAVTNRGDNPGPQANHISLLFNDSFGGMSAPSTIDLGLSQFHIAAADLDGNGLLDLIAATLENGTDFTIEVIPQTARGVFTPLFSLTQDEVALSLHAQDLDDDGHVDLIQTYEVTGQVAILWNNQSGFGSGMFDNPPEEISVGTHPIGSAIVDLNDNGRLDIVVALNGPAGDPSDVAILWNQGTRNFTLGPVLTAGTGAVGVTAADLNNDHLVDIVVANSDSDTLSILWGLGDQAFSAPLHLTAGMGPARIVPVDLNADGYLDLVNTNQFSNKISVHINNVGQAIPDHNGNSVPDDCDHGCGNGFIENPETCDDGNTDAGDGCASTCTVEMATLATRPNRRPAPMTMSAWTTRTIAMRKSPVSTRLAVLSAHAHRPLSKSSSRSARQTTGSAQRSQWMAMSPSSAPRSITPTASVTPIASPVQHLCIA